MDATKDAVKIVMMYQILTLGKTTTLQIKNELRNIGMIAIQDDVSAWCKEIQEESDDEYETFVIDDTEYMLAFGYKENHRFYYLLGTVPAAQVDDDCDCEATCGDDCCCTTTASDPDPIIATDDYSVCRHLIESYPHLNSHEISALLEENNINISIRSIAAIMANVNR